MRSLAVALAALAAFVAAVAPGSGAARSSSSAFDDAIVREVNAVRTAQGLRPLTLSPSLRRAAVDHSTAMLAGGFFAHESVDGSTFTTRLRRYYPSRGGSWAVGENLAMAGPGQPTAHEIVALWLDSPAHRANLLARRWRELGLSARYAAAPGGDFGGLATWVVTLDLGTRTK